MKFRTQTQGRQVFIIRAMQFTYYAFMSLLVAYFPLYFDSIGFTKLQIGAIYSIGPTLSILSNIVVGVISDKSQNIRRVVSLLFLGQILGLALLLPQKEFAVVSIIMAFFYFCQTPMNAVVDSINLLASEQLNRSFVALRMFGSLGYAIFAVVFGIVLKQYGSDLTIILGIIILAIGMLFSLFIGNYQASMRKFELRGLWSIVKDRRTIGFLVMIFFISIGHRINEGFLALTMRNLGADDSVIGIASLASAVSEIPMFFILAKYGYKIREMPLLAIAGAMYTLRFWLMSVATEPWMMVALQCMHIVTFAIFYITALRVLMNMIPEQYRASGQALYAVVWSGLSGVAAGVFGGRLIDIAGFSYAYRLGALFALLGTIGFLYLHFRRSET
ncbi:MAG: MFS transporter [Candidatus Cohnella colombiensis]|uniref:MFS transporter n=1 Tax=Candidatus Cohnella colombiensis TaxID=3121368 RepID=A0AA95F5S5_9BACL|nr:MAG: MFS transporter [Cohnella sp.]